jgi:hypothetical protein
MKLPELSREPDRRAQLVKIVDGGCTVDAAEIACWKDELIEQPTRTKTCSPQR